MDLPRFTRDLLQIPDGRALPILRGPPLHIIWGPLYTSRVVHQVFDRGPQPFTTPPRFNPVSHPYIIKVRQVYGQEPSQYSRALLHFSKIPPFFIRGPPYTTRDPLPHILRGPLYNTRGPHQHYIRDPPYTTRGTPLLFSRVRHLRPLPLPPPTPLTPTPWPSDPSPEPTSRSWWRARLPTPTWRLPSVPP